MIDEVQRAGIDQELVIYRRLSRHLDSSAYKTPVPANREGQDISVQGRAEFSRAGHRQVTRLVVEGHNRTAEEIVADNAVSTGLGRLCRTGNGRKAQIDA